MSSFRLIAGFLISFKSADMILDLGFLNTFALYAGIMAVFSLMLPLVYKYGKRMRLWSAKQFDKKGAARDAEDNRGENNIELVSPWSDADRKK